MPKTREVSQSKSGPPSHPPIPQPLNALPDSAGLPAFRGMSKAYFGARERQIRLLEDCGRAGGVLRVWLSMGRLRRVRMGRGPIWYDGEKLPWFSMNQDDVMVYVRIWKCAVGGGSTKGMGLIEWPCCCCRRLIVMAIADAGASPIVFGRMSILWKAFQFLNL